MYCLWLWFRWLSRWLLLQWLMYCRGCRVRRSLLLSRLGSVCRRCSWGRGCRVRRNLFLPLLDFSGRRSRSLLSQIFRCCFLRLHLGFLPFCWRCSILLSLGYIFFRRDSRIFCSCLSGFHCCSIWVCLWNSFHARFRRNTIVLFRRH